MNKCIFSKGLRKPGWLFLAALGLGMAGCGELTARDPSTGSHSSPQSRPSGASGDGVVLANSDGSSPEIQGVSGVVDLAGVVRISLPRDTSSFPPGPDLGVVDTTACLACHTPTDIAEFSAPPGPRFELVNNQCRDCHSADYTSSQPIMDRAAWKKVVVKMADKFGATEIKLSATEDHPHQSLMLDYIVAVYGKP